MWRASGDVLYVLAGLMGIVLVMIVLVDSWRVSLPEDRIHFVRNSFRKKKEPMYEDDGTINRNFRR